jgi:hypothetical protein
VTHPRRSQSHSHYVSCSVGPTTSRFMFESEAKYVQTLTVYGDPRYVCMYVSRSMYACTGCESMCCICVCSVFLCMYVSRSMYP